MGMEAVTFMKSHGHHWGLLEEAPQTVPSSHEARSQLGARHKLVLLPGGGRGEPALDTEPQALRGSLEAQPAHDLLLSNSSQEARTAV